MNSSCFSSRTPARSCPWTLLLHGGCAVLREGTVGRYKLEGELTACAHPCYRSRSFVDSLRLYERAMAMNPDANESFKTSFRCNAACSAVLIATSERAEWQEIWKDARRLRERSGGNDRSSQ